ncbi:hypothetical protein B9G55_11510 [Saccharibacillus sp. O16]|nr:hypothetical protein B9G55_11510 [Saccharibacillus sp. O16]
MMDVNKRYIAGVTIFIAVYATLFTSQAGLRPMLIVCGSMVGGLVLWIKTTFRTQIDTSRLLPVYLLTLALFFLHITEEFMTDFPGGINTVFGSNWTMPDFALLIALLGPIIWIGGAVGLYYRNPIGYYLAWFVFFGMLIGEPTHYLIFPVVQSTNGLGYTYFSGMWTALFPMIPAVYGLCLTLRAVKHQRERERHPVDSSQSPTSSTPIGR